MCGRRGGMVSCPLSFVPWLQNLISAATGVNLTTVDDPMQRKFLPSFLRGIAEENKLVTSPNFVVTQALVALLADKGARLRPNYDKAEVEKKGIHILCAEAGSPAEVQMGTPPVSHWASWV